MQSFSLLLEVVLVVTTTMAVPMTKVKPTQEEIASLLPVCKRTSSDFDECLMNATVTLRETVSAGMPDISLPPLDPLRIPTIRLEQATEELSYKAVLMDVEVRGLGDYEFTDIKTNLENLTITAMARFEHVYLDSDYMLMGKFQGLPVEGSGHLMANFTDNNATIKIHGGLVKRKDQMYFMTQDTHVELEVGDVVSNFENLYSGSDEKSMITDHILKVHSDELLVEVKPALETVISMLVDDVAGKFFSSLPYEKLFPQ